MRILSLFDGMACGYIALKELGVQVDNYIAYEIDKYAIQSATYNFPDIMEKGDVFKADFKEIAGTVDMLIGGSPCTYWSIAKTTGRETVASGMGWELFSQYVRALKEVNPRYFIYENNKSMSKDIRKSICETFGFEPICINSSLVSAQNRQRLYWVGIRQDDGTYKKAEIVQPEDRGIVLSEVLDTPGSYCMRYERTEEAKRVRKDYEAHRVHHGYNELRVLHPRNDDKSNTLTTVSKDNLIIQPINTTTEGKANCIRATCYKDGIRNIVGNMIDRKTGVAEQVDEVVTGKEVYRVKDGIIDIKGKSYPIKLEDGSYIIRPLSVNECKRLQTIPEWYVFPVSKTQALKQLGNGWTVEVIKHLMQSIL